MITILPYNKFSKSARALSKDLKARRLSTCPQLRTTQCVNLSRFDMIVNWGSSQSPIPFTDLDLNNPKNVKVAGNKLLTLEALSKKAYTPMYTTRPLLVQDYLDINRQVYCRKSLTSHSGHGIIIIRDGDFIPDCPLYVVGYDVLAEYRVHVFKGKVLDYQQKKKRKDTNVNRGIRNHSNGWVFCRQDVLIPDSVLEASIDAVNTIGLDFGAVDIAMTKEGPILFEINTAPGLENTTLSKYINIIQEYYYAMCGLR